MEKAAPVAQGADQSPGVRHRGPVRRGRNIYYTVAEWQKIVDGARACGRPVSVFARETSLGAVPPIVANAPLLRELCRCSIAVTQLAATARATGVLPEAERLDTALAELFTIARQLGSGAAPRRRP
jgi:hypothetical protein